MRNPRRPRTLLLTLAVALACLLGQAAAGAGDVTSEPANIAQAGPGARGGGAVTIMSEGFEGVWPPDPGLWTAYDGDGSASGEYYWDDVSYWDGAAYRAHSGQWSAWPANGGPVTVNPPAPYPANMKSWMVYGPFDLSEYSSAWLDFYYWIYSETHYDLLFWRASGDDFATFTQGSVSGDLRSWTYQSMDLADFLGDSSVWVAFYFQSDGTVAYDGPFVDDIGIYGVPTPPAAFGKTIPADGALLHDTGLSWQASAGATKYEYCLDNTDDDTCDGNWIDNGTLTTATALQLSINADYYWQVRAVNSHGTTYADGGDWWYCFTPQAQNFYSTGGYDGWVLERDETSDKGSDTLDWAGTTARLGDDASDRQYRSILDFDTTSLPDNAVIVEANLNIKRDSITGTNPFTTHGLLKVDIVAGTYTNDRALQRFDFHAVGSRGNVGRFIKTPLGGWYRAPLRAAAYPWINLEGLTQVRLRFELDDNDDMGADFISFYTGNASPADAPWLIVLYYVP
jgi:hypothetical protein